MIWTIIEWWLILNLAFVALRTGRMAQREPDRRLDPTGET